MTRLTREESKARTRERLLAQAWRLFREQGYSATSLEQIADAADVTKGAIYGHFENKEDLLLTAIEAAPFPDYFALLKDRSRPLTERLTEFGRLIAVQPPSADISDAAVQLEFAAALLRHPEALRRFGDNFRRRIGELSDAEDDQPRGETMPLEVWAIGQALYAGLQQYRFILPEALTPDAYARAFALLAGWNPKS